MSGLILKLGPKERILINRAVVENGDRRARLTIASPNANILRLRDAIHPEAANTPVRRACYATQLVLTADHAPEEAKFQLLRRIEELSQVFTDPDSRANLSRATDGVLSDNFYQSLKALRALLPREDRLFAHGSG